MDKKDSCSKTFSSKRYLKNGKLLKKGKKNSNTFKETDESFKTRILRKKDFQKLTRDV